MHAHVKCGQGDRNPEGFAKGSSESYAYRHVGQAQRPKPLEVHLNPGDIDRRLRDQTRTLSVGGAGGVA